MAKVAPDYHVQFAKCLYSVHPKYIGEKVQVKADASTVLIYFHGDEIARHKRCICRGQRSTDPSHIPPAHQEVLGWSGDAFRAEARRIGCRLVDDDENGCLTFEIRKGRFGFKLNAPYSAERRKAASELAKKNIQNLQQGKK